MTCLAALALLPNLDWSAAEVWESFRAIALGLEFDYGNQTRYAGIQFWVGGDQFIYLPLVIQ